MANLVGSVVIVTILEYYFSMRRKSYYRTNSSLTLAL